MRHGAYRGRCCTAAREPRALKFPSQVPGTSIHWRAVANRTGAQIQQSCAVMQGISLVQNSKTMVARKAAGTLCGCIVASVMSFGMPISASHADDAADTADGTSQGLEEIVVTAARREQSQLTVPISITAFSPRTWRPTILRMSRTILRTPERLYHGLAGPRRSRIFHVGSQARDSRHQRHRRHLKLLRYLPR